MGTIRKKVWQGMPVSNSLYAAWVDTHGYDVSLAECVLRAAYAEGKDRMKQPQEMVITTFWAEMDADMEHGPAVALLQQRFKISLTHTMRTLLREKVYSIEGWREAEWTDASAIPVLIPKEFVATYPSAAGFLPVRQDWIELMEGKLTHESTRESFQALIAEHNGALNPSGTNYVGEDVDNKKRVAASQGGKDNAITLAVDENAPKDKDALLEKNKDAKVVQNSGQEFIFTTNGQLWCWGVVDDVFSTQAPVAEVYGHFHLNDDARKEEKAGKSWTFAMKSGDHTVSMVSDTHSEDALPSFPGPLSSVLRSLEGVNVFGPSIECHEYSMQDAKNALGQTENVTMSIKPTVACTFTPMTVPIKTEEDLQNLGSRLTTNAAAKSWNWTTGIHNMGHLRIVDRLRYQETAQLTGLAPDKPGLYLQKAIRVEKDTLRRWA